MVPVKKKAELRLASELARLKAVSDGTRTPGARALGVFFVAGFLSLGALAQCPPPDGAEREWVRLDRVIDGDTVRLVDGRRVRFLGVDTPELARQGRPHEPLAKEARDLVRAALGPGARFELVYDTTREDRYGRTLAYIYDPEGRSLDAELLRKGLAFHVAIPPNMALADCLGAQQQEARERQLGLWQEPRWQPQPASGLSPGQGGFQWVRGRVTDVSVHRGTVWLELDGPVVLQVVAADRRYFGDPDDREWQSWLGRELLVSGWLIDRSGSRAAQRGFKPLMMRLRSPHSILAPSEAN